MADKEKQDRILMSVETSLAEVSEKLLEVIDHLEERLLEVWQMQADSSMSDVDLEALFKNIKRTSDGLAIDSRRVQECSGLFMCFRLEKGLVIDFSDLVRVLKELGLLDLY